jgi:predicted nucleotidyltransferase
MENSGRNLQNLIKELKRELLSLYSSRLKYLLLFGSYARGQEKPDYSDIDFLLVLDDFESPWTEIKKTGEIVSNISLKYGRTISLIPVKEEDYQKRKSPLMLNIRKEGRIL